MSCENIRIYRELATDQQIIEGQRWYADMTANIVGHSANSSFSVDQVAGIFAACSINTPWTRNVELAMKAIAESGLVNGTLKMVVSKVNNIIAGKDIAATLTSDKNNKKLVNFARNLAGDYESVTVDRWAQRVSTNFADCEFNGEQPCARNKKTGQLTGTGHSCGFVPKGEEYDNIANEYRQVASEFNESPAVTQAITWIVARKSAK